MALWKKTLIWLACIFGLFIVIALIFYFFISNLPIPRIDQGRYNLTKITQVLGSEQTTLEEFEGGDYYILVNSDDMIESHSQDKGISPNEQNYDYFLNGTELVVFYADEDGDVAYTGHYKGSTIRIEVRTQEGYLYYFYVKTQTGA